MSTERSRTSSRNAKKEDTTCGKCDKVVGKMEHGLKCDMCEMWHHTDCEGVPDSLYRAIQETDQGASQGLRWFCKKCNKFATGFMAGLNRLSMRQDALEEKVKDIEDHVAAKFKEVGQSQAELTRKVDNAVATSAKESLREMEDRELRKNNVIFFGIQECPDIDPEVRKLEDKKRVNNTISGGLDCIAEVTQTYRLGAKTSSDSKELKPRPLLVKLQNSQQAQNIIKSARKLKEHKDEKFQNITVKKDMTFLEREEMRKLVLLRNQKREETETQRGKEIWVIRRHQVVNIARTEGGDRQVGEEQ